jgi:phage protein D
MADLMSGKSSYEDLAKKYKNFMVPAYKIKVRGSDVAASLKLAVESLTLSLSLDVANSCSFTIVNAYDRKSSSFSSDVKSQFKLGTVLTVEVGYGSSTTMVFKGYVSELSYDFQDVPTISVSALDMRRLMMEGEGRMLIHSVQSYSDAFTEVMQRYQKICSSMVIDKTEKNLPNVTQSVSDFEFVTGDLATKGDREFFVLADKAYFRIPYKVQEPLTTLEWGKGLISFSRNSMYHNTAIKVVGFNEIKKEVLVGEVVSKSDDAQVDAIPEPQPSIYRQPNAQEVSQVKLRAESEGKKKKQKTQGGSGVCVGLPEVVPGRFIKLSKLDSDLDGPYYIKGVNHTLSGDGFTTSFTVGGWK